MTTINPRVWARPHGVRQSRVAGIRQMTRGKYSTCEKREAVEFAVCYRDCNRTWMGGSHPSYGDQRRVLITNKVYTYDQLFERFA